MMLQWSWKRWLLAGLCFYLLFTLLRLPAGFALGIAGGEKFSATGASGTAWNGSAESFTSGNLTATSVQWKFKPLSLLTFKTGANVKAVVAGGRVEADIYRPIFGDGGTAKNIKAVLLAQDLSALTGSTSIVNGKIGLDLQKASWDDKQLTDCEGNVTLIDLKENSSKVELGTFEIAFNGVVDNAISGVVSDLNAPFELDGTLKLGSERSYQFDGLIQASGETPSAIISALPFLGAQRDAQGNYTMNLSGSY